LKGALGEEGGGRHNSRSGRGKKGFSFTPAFFQGRGGRSLGGRGGGSFPGGEGVLGWVSSIHEMRCEPVPCEEMGTGDLKRWSEKKERVFWMR